MNCITQPYLKFLNHASYYIESRNSILICDPWLEGTAFNNGWSLLDKSSSNLRTIEEILKKNKNIYIWYSHEHSDHLSISFLRQLHKNFHSVNIIYQKTLDKRVINYFKSKKFNIIEATNGTKITLDNQLSFYVWSHKNGDSFSLAKLNDLNFLNLNDCIIDKEREAKKILRRIRSISKNIDFLFTQFGYANWVGNREDTNKRINASNEKIKRILIQANILSPKIIIPFASFAIFCNPKNFYHNTDQNTPKTLIESKLLEPIKNKIYFLKPEDKINIANINNANLNLKKLTPKAILHWENLHKSSKPIFFDNERVNEKKLISEYIKFSKKINSSLLQIPKILEIIKIIKPVKIFIEDINITLNFSYLNNPFIYRGCNWDIKIESFSLYHSLEYEYGFNTLKVNGLFQVRNDFSYKKFFYFFYFQDLIREGLTINNPKSMLKKLSNLLTTFIKKNLFYKL